MTAGSSADRARVYRFLARTFQPPEGSRMDQIRREDLPELRGALERLGAGPELLGLSERLAEYLVDANLEELEQEYASTFEPSGGAERPPNETAHAPETPQEGLTKTYELADIAGFYRGFGVEVAPGSERADHIVVELEFMHLLAVKEALAEERDEAQDAEICHDAAAAFLRDHLGRWCSKLDAWLGANACSELYGTAGSVLARFIELDMEDRERCTV